MLSRCPTAQALEAYALRPESQRVRRHLDGCATCRQGVAAAKQDHALLAELRQVLRDSDANAREHIQAICRRALAAAARPREAQTGRSATDRRN